MKGNKGITLIALIITIIIMLILVGITINIAMDGELFGKANETIKQQKIAEDRERLETAKEAERIEGYEDPENEPYPNVNDYFDRLVEEGIINDKEEDIIDNGDDTYEVTTEEEHVFKVTETEGDLIIEYVGETDELGPIITNIEVKNKKTNSIEIEVTGKRLKDVTYTYEYKKEGESEWKTAGTTEENTHIYTGLEANEIYNIRVKVENKRGSSEKETSVRTGEMTTAKVSFGETTWVDGEAKVIVTNSEEEYETEYQINSISGEWTKIVNGGEITGLNHGDTVYARLTDGTNHGEYASVDIQDKTNPQVTVTVGTTTSNSIAVNVTASDNESGMADSLTYTYYIKKTTESEYSQKASNNNASYTFTDLTQETTYDIKVEVTGDKAGNKGEGSTQGTTGKVTSGIEQGAITFGSTTWSNNQASVTVNTNTSYTIEYQKNTISGTWTTIANGGKITGLNHGDTVYARLTDGTNAGQYTSTSITDKTAPNVAVNKGTITSNSIAVSVTASDNQSGMASSLTYKYYIKKSTESAYTQKASNSNASYIFTGLTQGTNYNIKVEIAGDKAGNKGTGTVTAKTETVTSGTVTGAITFGTPTWSANKASMTINTNTSYKIEYQVNSISGTWTTIANGGTVSNLNHGDTIYARLTDGINHGSYASTTLFNINNSVARIGTKYYLTLQEAINDVPVNNVRTTIVLLKDISENVTTSANQNIILNLNNKTIENASETPIITLSGTLTVRNGEIIGTYSTKQDTIYVNTNSELNLSNTNVVTNSETANVTIRNYGETTVTGGSIISESAHAISNQSGSTLEISGTAEISSTAATYPTINSYGETTVTGGSITAVNSYGLYNRSGATATITGGTISSKKSNVINNQSGSTLEISGTAEISSTALAAITNYGETTITGGSITAEQNAIVNRTQEAILEISGTAQISSTSSQGNYVTIYNHGETTITGGTISSKKSNVINNQSGGTLEISGTAEIRGTSQNAPTIYNHGETTIAGGSITAVNSYGLYNLNGATATITGGSIISENSYGVYNQRGANITIRGGYISSRYGC